MSDDILSRLRCAYHKGDEPPCEECTFCAARAEIERLRDTGDALVDAMKDRTHRSRSKSIQGWKEARRG